MTALDMTPIGKLGSKASTLTNNQIYICSKILLLTALQNNWLSWRLKTRQPLWVILCRLPEKGRKEVEEIVEEMKERNWEERGTGMNVKKQKK